MTLRLLPPLAVLLAACATGRAPTAPRAAAAAAPATSADVAEAQARAADQAFSDASVAHDAVAFASFLEPDAVFVSRGGVAAGAATVCADWAPLLAAGGPTLAWRPDAARAAGGGDLVLTRGAFTLQPAGDGPVRTGRYLTVWRRGADGRLRVALDGSDLPLPPEASGALRRPLRRLESGDGRLVATAGLLMEGEREVGGFLLVEVREGDGWRVLVEAGDYRPARP